MDPFSTAPATSAGALCALHPEVTATTACPRCGNFMCSTCVGGEGATTCPTCRGATWVFPLRREGWSVMGVWDVAMRAFKRSWLTLSAALLVFGFAYYAFAIVMIAVPMFSATLIRESGVGGILMLGGLVLMYVAMILGGSLGMMGMVRICLNAYEGKPVSLGQVFSQFGQAMKVLKMWGLLIPLYMVAITPAAIGAALELSVLTVLGGIVQVCFMVAVGFALPFLPISFVAHPELGVLQHVVRTYRMLRGQVWGALGATLLGGLALMVGAFACGIGMVPAIGLQQLLLVGVFLTLENDARFENGRLGEVSGIEVIR